MIKLSSILLIDDDKTTNFLNRLLLEDLQAAETILVAENGQAALHLLEQQSPAQRYPDLILLDINMPVMNGFEFLEAYASLDGALSHSVILVMLTTSLNPRDVDRLQGLSIQGFLNKPLNKPQLQALLQKHFPQLQP